MKTVYRIGFEIGGKIELLGGRFESESEAEEMIYRMINGEYSNFYETYIPIKTYEKAN